MPNFVFHHIGDKKDYWNTPFEVLHCDGTLTFDGVYDSVLTHKEMLRGKDVILFHTLVGDGQERQLTFYEVQMLAIDMGWGLGWHTWTHPKLTELSDEQILRECKAPFETDLFAYPHGEFDERVIKLVKKMGYKKAYSTTQGNDDKFSLRRDYL